MQSAGAGAAALAAYHGEVKMSVERQIAQGSTLYAARGFQAFVKELEKEHTNGKQDQDGGSVGDCASDGDGGWWQ